ncbi:MAG: ABC transporter permease [Deltaproteobacteria bacterium]|nr:ABC transporter permease [Deltaproteobacteria bacterium]
MTFKPLKVFEYIGEKFTSFLEELGGIFSTFLQSVAFLFVPPFRASLFLKQIEFIGVESSFIVLLTGAFTGMVFALQTSYAFRLFGAQNLIGPSVALSLARELGPVLSGLMVTGRVGSAMAAELGTMKVTEQIDALSTMGINPVQYLITPRVVSSTLMLPMLTVLFDFIGIVGSYFMAVFLLGLNGERFISDTIYMVDLKDVYIGLLKAAVFGAIIAVVGCYKGYFAEKGAEGVGKAATQAVVISSVSILIADYFLTAMLF